MYVCVSVCCSKAMMFIPWCEMKEQLSIIGRAISVVLCFRVLCIARSKSIFLSLLVREELMAAVAVDILDQCTNAQLFASRVISFRLVARSRAKAGVPEKAVSFDASAVKRPVLSLLARNSLPIIITSIPYAYEYRKQKNEKYTGRRRCATVILQVNLQCVNHVLAYRATPLPSMIAYIIKCFLLLNFAVSSSVDESCLRKHAGHVTHAPISDWNTYITSRTSSVCSATQRRRVPCPNNT